MERMRSKLELGVDVEMVVHAGIRVQAIDCPAEKWTFEEPALLLGTVST